MELIAVELSTFTRRTRSVVAQHSSTGLRRGLEPGERVILRDAADGEYYSARVVDLDFDLEDTHYRFEVGVRLPADLALERLADDAAHAAGARIAAGTDDGMDELLALLAEARRAGLVAETRRADAN